MISAWVGVYLSYLFRAEGATHTRALNKYTRDACCPTQPRGLCSFKLALMVTGRCGGFGRRAAAAADEFAQFAVAGFEPGDFRVQVGGHGVAGWRL